MATIKWLCDACRTQYNTEQEAARCERELKGIKLPVTVKLGDKVYLRQAINPSILQFQLLLNELNLGLILKDYEDYTVFTLN